MSNVTTQTKIKDAFRELTVNHSFSKVKVADIIAKAGISRMTFYRHYLDKYAFPELAVSTTVFSGFDYYSAALRANTLTFQEAVNVKDSVSITLMGRYAKLNDAQKGLSCFAAAIDAAG